MSQFGNIKRNKYDTDDAGTQGTFKDVDWDFENYHDTRFALQQRSVHGWGVAAGLEVERGDVTRR